MLENRSISWEFTAWSELATKTGIKLRSGAGEVLRRKFAEAGEKKTCYLHKEIQPGHFKWSRHGEDLKLEPEMEQEIQRSCQNAPTRGTKRQAGL